MLVSHFMRFHMKTLKSHENISITYKIGEEILAFDDIEIEKQKKKKFYCHGSPIV